MLGYFQGNSLNTIDAKARVSIPSAYREVIEARSKTRTVLLAPHSTEDCVVGYDADYATRLHDKLERQYGNDFGSERNDAARFEFGLSERFNYDDNGRIVLSPLHRDLFGLDRLAYFIAADDTFEIWNPYKLLEVKGSNARLAAVVRYHLKAKGEPV